VRQVGQLPRIIAWCTVNKTLNTDLKDLTVTLYCECQPCSEMSAPCGNWVRCCIGGKRRPHLNLGRSVMGKSVQINYKSWQNGHFQRHTLFPSCAADLQWLLWPSRARLVSRPSDYNSMPTDSSYKTLQGDSHIACRAAKGLECVFPIWFTQCGREWFTLAMPCPCRARAMLWPCCSSQGHSTVRPSTDGPWATCPRSASSG